MLLKSNMLSSKSAGDDMSNV